MLQEKQELVMQTINLSQELEDTKRDLELK